MGSAGAAVSSPHLKSNTPCFNCLNSNPQPRALLRIDRRKPRSLAFSNKKSLKKFSRIVCSAVEDVMKKQLEISAGSLNGAAEDRAGKVDCFLEKLHWERGFHLLFWFLLRVCIVVEFLIWRIWIYCYVKWVRFKLVIVKWALFDHGDFEAWQFIKFKFEPLELLKTRYSA